MKQKPKIQPSCTGMYAKFNLSWTNLSLDYTTGCLGLNVVFCFVFFFCILGKRRSESEVPCAQFPIAQCVTGFIHLECLVNEVEYL